MRNEPHIGTRLSTTATTWWANWFHGELWLFPDGILRVPIGWLKSVCCVGYFAELSNPKTRTFDAEEFVRLISNPRNLWIPRRAIVRASLRYYELLFVYDLHVQMSDGRSLQILTLPKASIFSPIRAALREWLGEDSVSDPRHGILG